MVNFSSPSKNKCIRCGTCCKKSGPTLHRKDACLIPSAIPYSALATFRKGELAFHPTLGRLIELHTDMIKIKGKDEWGFTCIFFNDSKNACSIYNNRPIECRVLECWDPAPLIEMFLKDLLERAIIFDGELREVIEDYDARFPPQKVMRLVAFRDFITLSRMEEEDRAYRKRLVEQGLSREETLDLLLGRPIKRLRAALESLT